MYYLDPKSMYAYFEAKRVAEREDANKQKEIKESK